MSRVSRRVHPAGRHTLRLIVAVMALFAVFASAATWIALGHRDDTTQDGLRPRAQRVETPSSRTPQADLQPAPGDQRQDREVAADLAGLRGITVPPSLLRPIDAPIPTVYRHQPDLYARAFVERLLTQDYTTSRGAHLAWVQAESTRTDEPLVTGMVPPELRDRLALFSVTDQRSGPAPIPSAAEWAHLAELHGHTTVTVQKVTEPLAWSNAVEAGRVSDPGVTAREVTALVKLTTRTGGRTVTGDTSVDVILNLVGPPTRGDWAFATVITYRAVPMGASS
jgi:hypothetical protein